MIKIMGRIISAPQLVKKVQPKAGLFQVFMVVKGGGADCDEWCEHFSKRRFGNELLRWSDI